MRQFLIIFIVVSVGVGLFAYWLGFGRQIPNRKAQIVLRGHAFDIEVAETLASRAQGLSGRESLAEDTGLLFLFKSPGNHGFWMKDMKFSIDILWFRGTKLVGIEHSVPPPSPEATLFGLKVYYPPEDVDRVLELPAGTSLKYGLTPGDTFELRNYEIREDQITRGDIHRDPS
jgi:uncharacterized protein